MYTLLLHPRVCVDSKPSAYVYIRNTYSCVLKNSVAFFSIISSPACVCLAQAWNITAASPRAVGHSLGDLFFPPPPPPPTSQIIPFLSSGLRPRLNITLIRQSLFFLTFLWQLSLCIFFFWTYKGWNYNLSHIYILSQGASYRLIYIYPSLINYTLWNY